MRTRLARWAWLELGGVGGLCVAFRGWNGCLRVGEERCRAICAHQICTVGWAGHAAWQWLRAGRFLCAMPRLARPQRHPRALPLPVAAAGGCHHQEHAQLAQPGHGAAQGLLPPGELQPRSGQHGRCDGWWWWWGDGLWGLVVCASKRVGHQQASWPWRLAKGHRSGPSLPPFTRIHTHPVHTQTTTTTLAQYLCTGLEDDIGRRRLEAGGGMAPELGQLVGASGKMVLLHKLLPKLKAEGHKVGGGDGHVVWGAGRAPARSLCACSTC